jgi:hypothetical protein
METPDDEFPYASDDPSLAPIEAKNTSLPMSSQQANDLKAALRLLIGSSLNGSDVLIARVRQMQSTQVLEKMGSLPIDENETLKDQLRYLLLGILFEIPDRLQRNVSSTSQFSSKVYDLFSHLLSPVTDSLLFKPVRQQFDLAAARGEKVVDRLVMKGRIEEQNSRQMFQQKAIDDLINEFVEYLVVKIKVQEIIQQEGMTMAGDVVGDFQAESANVDNLLENKLKSIFRNGANDQPSVPPSSPAQEG